MQIGETETVGTADLGYIWLVQSIRRVHEKKLRVFMRKKLFLADSYKKRNFWKAPFQHRFPGDPLQLHPLGPSPAAILCSSHLPSKKRRFAGGDTKAPASRWGLFLGAQIDKPLLI